jgi:hypothetical protein
MTHNLITQYARQHNDRVITWQLPSRYAGTDHSIYADLDTSRFNILMAQNNQLLCHFVTSAPAFITTNTNPLRGLANGTPVILTSLEWCTQEKRFEAMKFLNENPTDIFLPESLWPSNILVSPKFPDEIVEQWPTDLTCIPGNIVIPIEIKPEPDILTSGDIRVPIIVERPQVEIGMRHLCISLPHDI